MMAVKRLFTGWRWTLPLLVLGVSFWLTLFCRSAVPIGALESLRALLPGPPVSLAQALVLNLRLPRSLVAMLLGASLALAGSLLQILTRNPLASPSLFGINAGASLAMVVVSALSPQLFSGFSIALVAALGGGVSWGAVMLMGGGWQQAGDRSRMILAGVAVSALCAALAKATLILSEDHAYGILSWQAGGVAHARWPEFWHLFPFTAIIVPWVLLLASRLNLLQVSDDSAQTLGVNLPRLRLTLNLMVLLLVGACVSVAGPLAFIGLLVPHISRYWIGYDLRRMLPLCMIFGATLMLLADLLARFLAWPGELPAGVVLALIGAPFFVWLVRTRT